MTQSYRRDRKNSMDMLTVRNEAQKIAFAPLIFQAVNTMLKLGILECISQENGASCQAIMKHTGLTEYAVTVLTDITVYAEIISKKEDTFFITKIGTCLLEDPTTQVNFNFVNDVCYQGAFHLTEAIKTEKATGLKVFGKWETIYQGLCSLPAKAQKSWFDFDNYYSDISFQEAIEILLKHKPAMVYDIGANTGKFGTMLLCMDTQVQLTCFDLPAQLAIAKKNINSTRAQYKSVDILQDDDILPKGADVIWMSQFLDCFNPEKIKYILKKALAALNHNGRIFILEPFIDRQRSNASALSLAGTSLYFTIMANGYSKMYNQPEFEMFITDAGLKIATAHQNIGEYDYTLLECVKA